MLQCSKTSHDSFCACLARNATQRRRFSPATYMRKVAAGLSVRRLDRSTPRYSARAAGEAGSSGFPDRHWRQARCAGWGWSRKKRSISRDASGPRGSV